MQMQAPWHIYASYTVATQQIRHCMQFYNGTDTNETKGKNPSVNLYPIASPHPPQRAVKLCVWDTGKHP